MRYQCTFCQSTFSLLGNKKTHERAKHGVLPTTVCKCGYANENYQSLNAHYRHCLIHRNGKPVIPTGSKGNPSPCRGLTLEEFVGKERAAITKKKLSLAGTGRPGTKHTEEMKRWMSEHRIKILESSPHVKWFEVGGIKVQGTWERDVAKKLITAGLKLNAFDFPTTGIGTIHPISIFQRLTPTLK